MKETRTYEKYDGCCGRVIGRCRTGSYLTLDNGQEAFAYKFACLPIGSEVLCTVLRLANEDRRMLVSIDAVRSYAEAA